MIVDPPCEPETDQGPLIMLEVPAGPSGQLEIPFDAKALDALMDEAGIDVLIANSKHNVQYLLGGFRSLFFQHMDAIGVNRYLPLVVYPKGAPEKAAYIGHGLESHQKAVEPFWPPETDTSAGSSPVAMQKAIDHVSRLGVAHRTIGVEFPFLPLDAANLLRGAFSESTVADALFVLERLRARKSAAELTLLRRASENVVESMKAVIANHGAGVTKRGLVEALQREETSRGLNFEYCLITMGTNLNRAPSGQRWEKGDILSLDSGANYQGYIGDLTRMAILGEPDAELEDLLSEIETIQRAAMRVVKPGALGAAIYEAAGPLVKASKHRNDFEFLAHGMGLVTHEAPRLTASGPIPYDDYDAGRPLEEAMVISIETTLKHPRRGFIKLEDTIAVTNTGYEIYGEGGRGWNRAGGI
jgi:Xaa-Pro aminopeptidase